MKNRLALLLSIVTSIFITQKSHAQNITVKSINAAKGIVVISSGKNDNVRKKSRICFYNGDKKITCGKAKKVRSSSTLVKVKKSKIKKITKESVAKIKTKKRRKKRRNNSFRSNIKLAYSYMFLAPTTYNTPFYKHLTQSDGNGGAESREPQGPNTSPYGLTANRPQNSFGDSFLGGGLELEVALGKKMSLTLGGRYTHTNETINRFSLAEGPSGKFDDSGYETTHPTDSYIDITTTSSALGAWLDFNFYGLKIGRSMLLKFGVGIDAEFNALNIIGNSSIPPFDGEKKVADIANNQRLAIVLSGRLPIDFSYNMKNFGIGFKIIPMLAFTKIDLDPGDQIINGPSLNPTLKVPNDDDSGNSGPINDENVRLAWEKALFEDDLGYGAGGFSLEIQPIYFAYYF